MTRKEWERDRAEQERDEDAAIQARENETEAWGHMFCAVVAAYNALMFIQHTADAATDPKFWSGENPGAEAMTRVTEVIDTALVAGIVRYSIVGFGLVDHVDEPLEIPEVLGGDGA